MNKIVLTIFLIIHSVLLIAQNEVDLISFNYTSKWQPSIENDDYIQLKDVATTTITKGIVLNYGHPIGNKGIEALYSLDYQHYNQKWDLSNVVQDSIFNIIPENYYHQPSFSQLSIVAGLVIPMAKDWSFTSVFMYSITDDFIKPQLPTHYSGGGLAYFSKEKNKQFTYGFGMFISQLEGGLFTIPVIDFSYQNKKRGIEVLFPQNIRLWQKTGKNSYLEANAGFSSYSLEYHPDNLVNSTDIYEIKAGLIYNYLWQDFLKISFGVNLPVDYYDVNTKTETFEYKQQNGLGLNIGISVFIITKP